MLVCPFAPQVDVLAHSGRLCVKKGGLPKFLWVLPLRRFLLFCSLSTEAKLLDDSSVSLDVYRLEIVKYTTTLTYKLKN